MPDYPMYYSQAGQDGWVIEMTSSKRDGFYVDIGAHNGVSSSNTYELDKTYTWKGICIEAHPEAFQQLVEARPNAININCAVTDYNGKCLFGGDRVVEDGGVETPCFTLYSLFKNNNAPNFIDYLSIDIEGHEPIVFAKFFEENDCFTFGLITVEHNVYSGDDTQKKSLYKILTANEYERVLEDVTVRSNDSWNGLPYEDWYRSVNYEAI